MTGPVDTAEMRERAHLRKAAACALCNDDVLALCDALDTARKIIEDYRELLTSSARFAAVGNLPAIENSFREQIKNCNEALGEEKQR